MHARVLYVSCVLLCCFSALPGVGERGRPGTLLRWGQQQGRENKSHQCEHEIKTKSVLAAEPPLCPPLRRRWFFLPVESSTSPPITDPSLPFLLLQGPPAPTKTSPNLAALSLLSPSPQEAFPFNHQSFVYGSPLENG